MATLIKSNTVINGTKDIVLDSYRDFKKTSKGMQTHVDIEACVALISPVVNGIVAIADTLGWCATTQTEYSTEYSSNYRNIDIVLKNTDPQSDDQSVMVVACVYCNPNYGDTEVTLRAAIYNLVADSCDKRGYAQRNQSNLNLLTAFKKFGAKRNGSGSVRFTANNLLESLQGIVDYFGIKKAKIINELKDQNTKLVKSVQQGIRKIDIKKANFNNILADIEDNIHEVYPDLSLIPVDRTSESSSESAKWEIYLCNCPNMVYRDLFNDGRGQAVIDVIGEDITSVAIENPDIFMTTSTYNTNKYANFRATYCADEKTAEQIDNELINKLTNMGADPAKIKIVMENKKKFNSNILYTCDGINPSHNYSYWNSTCNPLFAIFYDVKKDTWSINYSSTDTLPEALQTKLSALSQVYKPEDADKLGKYAKLCMLLEKKTYELTMEYNNRLAAVMNETESTELMTSIGNRYEV